MAGFDYKNTLAWTEAMDLIVKVSRLCEELPQTDLENMSSQLRQTGTAVLQDVATAVVSHSQPSIDKLIAVDVILGLVDQTYPALDTAGVEKALHTLVQRYQGNFAERRSQLATPPAVPITLDNSEADESEPEQTAMPVEAPSNFTVPVAQEDSGVHPNSG